jgi:hypothetical protein
MYNNFNAFFGVEAATKPQGRHCKSSEWRLLVNTNMNTAHIFGASSQLLIREIRYRERQKNHTRPKVHITACSPDDWDECLPRRQQ